MAVVALVTWLVTAAGGAILVGIWFARGGPRAGSGTRLAPGLVFGHVGLAVLGLVFWIAYLATDTGALAWVGFGALLPVALLGFTMFARWLASRRTEVAEAGFPIVVVLGHGLLAAVTLVLALLAAAGVG
jgi:hypothetical protein